MTYRANERRRCLHIMLSAADSPERSDFNVVEFDHFRMHAGLPSFVLSSSEWIEKTHATNAIRQMQVLENVEERKLLKEENI